jgi:hypothetical protein
MLLSFYPVINLFIIYRLALLSRSILVVAVKRPSSDDLARSDSNNSHQMALSLRNFEKHSPQLKLPSV